MPFLESDLPFISSHLPGVGGAIKQNPEDFVVTEVPLYEPAGEGDHLYFDIERRGIETRFVVKKLAELFDVDEKEVGCAGRKDKHAVSRQWLSIPWPHDHLDGIEEKFPQDSELTLHGFARHKNKLKRGHNLGNRFRIRIRDVVGDKEKVGAIADLIRQQGLPNFYGPQRFGRDFLNADIGKAILKGRRVRSKSQRTLMLNAWQSDLFNRWLTMRLQDGGLNRAYAGDIAKTEDRGGLFEVEDVEAENVRLAAQEIHITGPMFGSKMMGAKGTPGIVEEELLQGEKIPPASMRRNRLSGSRRLSRVLVPDLAWELEETDLLLSFFLPKGSYATILTREFTRLP